MHHKSQNLANKLNSSHHKKKKKTGKKPQAINYKVPKQEKSAGIISFLGPQNSRIFINR